MKPQTKCLGMPPIQLVFLGFSRMCEYGDGDAEASSSAALRQSFALGRALPGRISLNPPPPGRLTSLRSRDLTLGGFKKVALSNLMLSTLFKTQNILEVKSVLFSQYLFF